MGHRVERLNLDVEMAGLDGALALRARVEDLSRTRFPLVVERVLDAAIPADLHLRLDRLDLDLGAIAAERLEEDGAATLERALAEAVAEAVARARQAPGDGARALTAGAAALEDLDAYLVTGTAAEDFDPAAMLAGLIEREPEALTAMLHRRARDRHVIERLVLQAGEGGLRALLEMLAPADAAVILAYHADLRRLYAERRPPPVAVADLPRTLWVLTLEFLLRDPGSQSNRRAFLAHLLGGLAAAEGIAYSDLLTLLRDILEQTRKKHPPTSSLPGVLKELFERLPDESAEARGAPAGEEPAAAADGGRPETPLRRLRHAEADREASDGLEGRGAAPAFAQLVERLEPADAALIRTYLDRLAELHRQAPLLPLSPAGLERQLHRLALRLLPDESGRAFDRRSWQRRLLRGLARAGGVSYEFLLESLADASPPAADSTAGLPPPAAGDGATAELGGLARLLSRLRRHAHDRTALSVLVRGVGAADFRRLLELAQPRHARDLIADLADLRAVQRQRSLFALSGAAFETQLRLLALQPLIAVSSPPFRRRSWLKQLLEGLAKSSGMKEERVPVLLADLSGALANMAAVAAGAAADQGHRDETALARRLAEAPPADQAELLRWLAGDPGLLLRVAAGMDEVGRTAALAVFGPTAAEAVAGDLAFLGRRHDAEPLARLDGAAFRRLTWALAVTALAQAGGRLHRAEMRRFLLAGVARYEGVSAAELGDWRGLAAEVSPPIAPPSPDPLALAESYLRSGSPPAFGPRLVEAASGDPAGFAALLRRLTVAASGNSDRLIDRLLTWMLPEEIAAALFPGAADRAASRAESLADAPGGSMAAAWQQILRAALAGEELAEESRTSPGERHDRLAILRHWLDRGTLPWWAPPDSKAETLLASLAGESVADLRTLFGHSDTERIAARLARAVRRMGPAAGRALIERLAPWAFAPAGPVAAAGLAGVALDDLRIRAAAAAVAGSPLDLDRLARPVPVPPEAAAEPPEPSDPDDTPALFAWLLRPEAGGLPARLARRLAELADRGDARLDAILREGLARAETRTRWAADLPDEVLARIVHRAAPARARFILDLKSVLGEALRQAAPSGGLRLAEGEMWALALAVAADGDSAAPRAIAGRMIAAIAEAAPAAADGLRGEAALAARRGGHANLLAALQPAASGEPARPAPPAKPPPQDVVRAPEGQVGGVNYVENAGLVLFNPFLPRFFERLGVLTTGTDGVPRVAGIEAASRAVHLLQYLVDERFDRREPCLVLNKLLCGLPLAAPVARSIDPRPEDLALCAELVQAVIANWPSIRNSSPAALRETFLQREGRLRRADDRWTLDVERKTVDVLVDQIPWNRAVVFHRWMAEPLHVDW